MRSLIKTVAAVAGVPVFLLVMILLHEAGHAGTAKLLAGIDCEIYFWPGIEIYPDFGEHQPTSWNTSSIAMTKVVVPDSPATLQRVIDHNNVILFMGSGTTQLLSLLSLIVLSLLKPKGPLLWLLIPGALLHIDMLSYTIFPLLHMRHLLFWGGNHSETLMALGAVGVPLYVSAPAIVLLSIAQLFWLYRLLAPRRVLEKPLDLAIVPRY